MFGALNRFISRLDSDGPSQAARDGHGAFGFQVLRNKNLDIAIEPWYDLVIGINGRQVDDPDANLFAQEVRNCAGASVTLTLWNAKGQRVRSLQIPVPTPSPTLGLTLQWNPLSVTEDVWHILEVIPDSPADVAGLLPYGDYIVGTPEGIVHGEPGLGELVEDYLLRSLRLYVYNHEYGVTRLVTITPSRSWGGSGALGCVLGFGALHRLPLPLTEPPAAPGETLFETARFSNEESRPTPQQPSSVGGPGFENPPAEQSNFLVPASMTLPPPAPSASNTSPGHPRAGRKARHAASSNQAFDDYFMEGEQRSKEEDLVPAAKSIPPPPPPKSGNPPPKAKSPIPEVQTESSVTQT